MNTIKIASMSSQLNGSDKVYQVQIDEAGEGLFMVRFANARRGSALKLKDKTTSPVSLEVAEKEFNKIVKQKTSASGGYTIDGNEVKLTSSKAVHSGISLQLLNPIDEAMAHALCQDPKWAMQEKHDGERRAIVVKDNDVLGTNKRGEVTSIRAEHVEKLKDSPNVILDTEDLGFDFIAFDLLELNGHNLQSKGFLDRYKLLECYASEHNITLSAVAVSTEDKTALMQRVKERNGEGVVFKLKNAPYTANCPSSGGSQLKFKFYDEVSVIVLKQNVQRSVKIGVIDGDNIIPVGNVSIPPNAILPSAGDIIEVRYLYAYKGGSLYQPTYNKPRPTQNSSDCSISKLKYKPDSAA